MSDRPAPEDDVVLNGDRVTLRRLVEADLETVFEMLRHPAVDPWWHTTDLDRLRRDLIDDPFTTAFVVSFDDAIVGVIQYYEENEPEYRYAALDIAIHGDFQNRGLGTDALRTLARYLFDRRGHHRLTIDPSVTNDRAIAVYRRIGFRPIGVARDYERTPDGGLRDGLLMDMLVGELE